MEISGVKQDVIDKLCKDFKVDPETCTKFEDFYNSKIESKLKLRYLSHLVSTIEDMINDAFKEQYITPILRSEQYTPEQKRAVIRRNYRLYSIILRPINGLNRKGFVQHLNYGSIIGYNPDLLDDDNDTRILIAHELGHIINMYVLKCKDTQNRANVFSFTAVNGKDQFYKSRSEQFTYSSELAIIDAISKICPIKKHEEIDSIASPL
jgi:hypothetical protein